MVSSIGDSPETATEEALLHGIQAQAANVIATAAHAAEVLLAAAGHGTAPPAPHLINLAPLHAHIDQLTREIQRFEHEMQQAEQQATQAQTRFANGRLFRQDEGKRIDQ